MSRIEQVKPAAKFRNPLRTKRNSVIVAVALVVVSVVAINIAIKSLSGAHEYLVAKVAVAAGTPLNKLATKTISLNLGEAAGDYLGPGEALANGGGLSGLTISRGLAAGNLILKRDLVALNPNDELVHLAVPSKTALPSKLEAGSKVDLWAAVNDGSGQFGQPELIAQGVQVFSTGSSAGLFGESANRLELSVFQRDVKPILASVLRGDALSVVARDGVH